MTQSYTFTSMGSLLVNSALRYKYRRSSSVSHWREAGVIGMRWNSFIILWREQKKWGCVSTTGWCSKQVMSNLWLSFTGKLFTKLKYVIMAFTRSPPNCRTSDVFIVNHMHIPSWSEGTTPLFNTQNITVWHVMLCYAFYLCFLQEWHWWPRSTETSSKDEAKLLHNQKVNPENHQC